MTTTDMLAHASHYARRGWPVHPLVQGGKRPATTNGFLDATTDPEQVREWWSQADYNVGIAVPPGVVVIDVDPRNGGNETARQLVRDLGALPHTKVARTRAGGYHYYLQTYLSPDQICGSLGAGVDVKIAGRGYVVAPPSRVEPGQYEWLNQARLAFLTESWAKRLRKPSRAARPERSPITDPVSVRGLVWWECGAMRHTKEGYRNPHLYSATRRLIDSGCFTAEAEAQLAEAAAESGLDADEVAGVIASAVRGAGA